MEKTYRFVKASERKPEKTAEYFIRIVHENAPDEIELETAEYSSIGGWLGFSEGWTVIEWLEEIPKDERQKEPSLTDHAVAIGALGEGGSVEKVGDTTTFKGMTFNQPVIIGKSLAESGDAGKQKQ